MHRQSLLQLLKEYESAVPFDEKETVVELIQYISENSHCFEREAKEGAKHIAASVLLITPDFKKALFLWHTKIGRQPLLVGHCLDLIVQNTQEKWVILGNKDKVKSLLGKLFEADDPGVVSVAKGVVGRLSARGYTEFLGIKESS